MAVVFLVGRRARREHRISPDDDDGMKLHSQNWARLLEGGVG